MPPSASATDTALVTFGATNGLANVFRDTPLAKLHYFDGRYLRAEDLTREQRYHEVRSELVAMGQGAGPVFGLGIDPPMTAGAALTVAPGLGFNEHGEMVHLVGAVSFDLAALIAATAQLTAAAEPAAPGAAGFGDCRLAEVPSTEATSATEPVYLITIAPAAAFCGRQDVYGQLCEAACVQGSAANLVLSGTLLRARPVALTLPPVSGSADAHLRSRLATAWFRREAARRGALLAPGGLRLHDWCGTADAGDGREIDLALALLRNGAWIVVDQWTARRERMTPLPLGVWQGRMGMRRQEVFLAEVLQFQCQLSDILAGADVPMPTPALPPSVCADLIGKLELTEVQRAALARIVAEMPAVSAAAVPAIMSPGWLFTQGLVELPPTGFLPVDPASATGLRQQVANLLGPHVDFRLIAAPAEVIPHAFEEARDMRRIPLVPDLRQAGETRPQLEVYVPDATITAAPGLDDYRSTHAGLHAMHYLQVLASIGMTVQAVSGSGLLGGAVSDIPVLPSVLRCDADASGRGGTLALLSGGVPVGRMDTISTHGNVMAMGPFSDRTAGPAPGGMRLDQGKAAVLAAGEALLAAEGKLSGGIGLDVRVMDVGFGGAKPMRLDWDLALHAAQKGERFASKGEIVIFTQRGDDLPLAGELEDTMAQSYYGEATITAEFETDYGGQPSDGSVQRTVALGAFTIEDEAFTTPPLYILANLWDKTEVGDAKKFQLPLSVGLVFLRTETGFVPQALRLYDELDYNTVERILDLREQIASPNGLTDRFDRSVAGASFETMLALVEKVGPALAGTIRERFRRPGTGGSAVAATRDWVMFRRSRAVTEIAEPVPPNPAKPPRELIVVPPRPEPRTWRVGGARMAVALYYEIDTPGIATTARVAELVLDKALLPRVRSNADDVIFSGLTLSSATAASVANIERNRPWVPANEQNSFSRLIVFASAALLADAQAFRQLASLYTSIANRLGIVPAQIVVTVAPDDQRGADDALILLVPVVIA